MPRLRAPFLPMLWDGVRNVPNTLHRRAWSACDAIEEKILEEGPDTISMVIAEPVQNGRGALVPPDGYWPELRRICDKYGVLLCADEVINGFGRLGAWFGSEIFGVVPDLLTFAKGVTSAYAPLGGVIATPKVVDEIAASPLASFVHGSTFGGHPVATAVAVANLTAMRDERIIENVVANQGHLANRMRELHDTYDIVKETRGMGYFYAFELMASRRSGDRPLSDEQSAGLLGGGLATFLREARLHTRADDRGATMLVIAPPLICGTEELDDLIASGSLRCSTRPLPGWPDLSHDPRVTCLFPSQLGDIHISGLQIRGDARHAGNSLCTHCVNKPASRVPPSAWF